MTEVEKKSKKSKSKKAQEAEIAIDDQNNESVTDSIGLGIAALRSSGLLDEETPAESVSTESAAELTGIEWQMADSEMIESAEASEQIDLELGTSEEAEHMNAASEEINEDISDEAASEGLSEEETALADQELGPAEFIEAERVVSIIESLLFASERPVSVNTIKQIFKGSNIRGKDITRCLEDLASDYADGRRGVTLEELNGGYQLRTKVDNAEYLRRLSKSRPFRLSGPALETLSIIAYKQPITKHEVDEIRGVESGHLVRALMERSLVNFEGKSDLPGKPMLYATTRKFLEIFGLRNLKELPTLSEIDELLPDGIGAEVEEEKPKLADITGDLTNQVAAGSYSEGEEELEKINASLAQVDTSSQFFEQEKIRQREKRDAERAANIREALAVGEKVDVKDQRWLTRYEAKLNAPPVAESEAQEATTAAAVEESKEFVSDVEALSEELQDDNREGMAMTAASDEDDAETIQADGESIEDGLDGLMADEIADDDLDLSDQEGDV